MHIKISFARAVFNILRRLLYSSLLRQSTLSQFLCYVLLHFVIESRAERVQIQHRTVSERLRSY